MGRASPPPDSTALLTRSDVDFIRLLRADPVFAGRMLIGDDYPPHTRAQLRAIMKATLGLAVQGRGFCGFEGQVQAQAAVLGRQVKFFPLKLGSPIVDPDLQGPRRRPG